MSTINIPYGKQEITPEDIQKVTECLQADFLTQGPQIKEFEEQFAAYVGAKYAVAVANGTAALHLAAMVLGVDEKSKVITTPITFAASANCVQYCGGEVVFADIDPDTYLLDIEAVQELIQAHPAGTFQGIIPVDFAGRPVNLEAFRKLADEHGLWLLEDACHAPGGYFMDSKNTSARCGGSQYADLAIFSFHPVKHIACGEGGMITTNNEAHYRQLLMLRTHGITRETGLFENSPEMAAAAPTDSYPGWYMEMQQLGYNYRLTDIQAALGISQLGRITDSLAKRKKIAEKYFAAFQGKPFIKGQSGVVEGHAYHLYVIEAEDRLGLYTYLRTQGIYAQVHYIPCHLMPYYRKFGWKEGDFPHAETYYRHCLSLPMYPTLSDEQQDYVIEKVSAFYA